MLFEIIDYATKLLSNMTATTTNQFNITTTNLNSTKIATPPPSTNTTTSLPPINSRAHFEDTYTFNASVRTLFNKTLATMTTTTNFSGYTEPQYSTLPPLNVDGGGAVGSAADHSVSVGVVDVTTAAATSLPAARHALETSTFPAQTVATFFAGSSKNRATTIIVYPTVSPESIVIPIVSCIFGFPILALIVICCLRRRAKLARERDRRRNYDMQDHAVSLVRFSPIHRLNYRSSRAISLRSERSLSQGFPSLELDTVLEERCSDVEQTQTEILNPESPMETCSNYKITFSS